MLTLHLIGACGSFPLFFRKFGEHWTAVPDNEATRFATEQEARAEIARHDFGGATVEIRNDLPRAVAQQVSTDGRNCDSQTCTNLTFPASGSIRVTAAQAESAAPAGTILDGI